MRKNKVLLLIYSQFLVLFACHNDPNATNHTTLQFYDDPVDGGMVSETISKFIPIPLETKPGCLIGEIEKIVMDDSLIYIQDRKSNSLFVFNLKGKFIFKISSVGNGPGEYIYLRDFYIDNDSRNIFILGAHNKILKYNLSGKLLNETRLKFMPLKFVAVSPQTYYFWNNNNSPGQAPVVRTNSKFEIKESFFTEIERAIGSNTIFTLSDKDINLRPFPQKENDMVYGLTESNLYKKYSIDFSSKKLPYNLEGNITELRKSNIDYCYFFRDFIEGDEWITFHLTYNKREYSALYNKQNNESCWWISKHPGTLPEIMLSSVISRNGRSFIGYLEPMYLRKFLSNYKTNDLIYNYNHLENSLHNFYDIITNSKVSDNPIVFCFELSPN
ncbi:6-bladed beta-propeller [Saccharicrinis sp. FJH2]|uniref:6-bladed beta-propeller n=1 Tax=Saccharicrinis sp. FJH65 TaxID=3344659 RepID=UPI0035F3E0A4